MGDCYRRAKVSMAFVAVPNVCKCVVVFGFQGETYSNTIWAMKEDFSTADQEALAAAVGGGWGAGLKPQMSSQAAYIRTVCYDMRAADGPIVTDATGAGNGTKETGEALPISAAMVVTLHTAARGRSGRGRLFVAGFSEGQWNGYQFDSTTVAAVVSLTAALESAINTAGFNWCLVSHQINGVARVPPAAIEIVTTEVRSPIAGTQRRRMRRP